MGDMADMSLDTLFGGNDPECLDDGFWMYDEESDHWMPSGVQHSKSMQCRYCGKKRLHWSETEAGWRLFESSLDKGEQLHSCSQYFNWQQMQLEKRRAMG